jgi:hypothetical protein
MLVAALLGALTLGGLVAFASPASADTVCLYKDTYYRGSWNCVYTWKPDYTQLLLWNEDRGSWDDGSANNVVRSIENKSPYRICVYANTGFWGTTGYLYPWASYPTLWMNDMISSHRIC